MKKLFSLIALLALVAFVGCEKKSTDEGVTSFTLSQTELEVSADGGAQNITYSLENPQHGAVVLTNCSANWIKELSTATVGEIKFAVMPNYTPEARETVIDVQYTALEEKFQIKVKQDANTKPMFAFEVVSNEPTRLLLNVTPANLSTAYICRAYTEAHIDVNNLYEDEFLAEYDMEAIEYEAYYAGQTFLNYLQNITHTGQGFDIEFTKLTPDTNYVVYAYHIDLSTGKICSDIYREVIRTAEPETAEFDVEMTLEVSGAVITQTITPADKEVYYYTYRWSVEEFYMYYGFSAVMEETFVAKWNEQMMAWVQNGYQPYQIVDQNCFKGDKVIEHTDLKAETDYVFYIFAVDRETGFAASDITIMEKRTNKAHASDMTIEIVAKNIFQTTADVYWTASDPNGKFARSVFTKAEFEALGANDEEKLETCLNEYGFYQAVGSTDMNLTKLIPGTTYVAFAYGLDGETPNTRIFKTEFTTLSDNPGMSDINLSWTEHYNLADVAAADAAHWGDYAAYENYTLVPLSISGVTASDEVYIMVTTMPIDYYSKEAEWLRDVAKEKNRVNCYTNYNYVAEYEKEYTVVAVAKDKNGNYGQLFLEEMYLYKSDDKPASEYTYKENK
ncbi:MAG: BACON domain-containing protein [Alistipes sp.]|nr:BACON domain-containing protein [Alistipes sp.]